SRRPQLEGRTFNFWIGRLLNHSRNLWNRANSTQAQKGSAGLRPAVSQTGGLRYSRPEACATFMYPMRHLASLVCIVLFGGFAFAAEKSTDLKNLSLSGGIDQGKARLVIEGWLNSGAEQEKSAFATTAHQSIRVDQTKLAQTILLTFDIVTGSPKEFALAISGDGEIRQVTGEQLQDWSVRQ